MDTEALAAELLNELNLDDAELTTLQAQIESAIDITKRSAGQVDETNPTAIKAVKTIATQLYYDRTLSEGLSRGVMMMLTHLQAGAQYADKA
ncbi:hypothetical protein [Lacticaseibacillus daqingensis]|uniref:hypothetical protein n=1 Tax=Lacticaseibacillus daqingensis TaxID=2486014 RepID=UPI000F79440A|nr:hypothetical protein [Lacticaseibacillus daqingensis]